MERDQQEPPLLPLPPTKAELEEAKRLAVAAYWSNPNDETFLAAAEATKALNGGRWPT